MELLGGGVSPFISYSRLVTLTVLPWFSCVRKTSLCLLLREKEKIARHGEKETTASVDRSKVGAGFLETNYRLRLSVPQGRAAVQGGGGG